MEQNKCLILILVLDCINKSILYLKVFSVFMLLHISFFVHFKIESAYYVLFLIRCSKVIILLLLLVQTHHFSILCLSGFQKPVFLPSFPTSSPSSSLLTQWSFWNTNLPCMLCYKFLNTLSLQHSSLTV